jgi:curli biogenesis system outer membrane secretion channel CsgG
MKRTVLVTAFLLGMTLPGFGQQKKRVAVLNFDYATVQSSVAAIFGMNNDIGKGISDLLVEKLVTSGKYSVIERKALDKVLAEQNFSNSDRADPNTAAKIGKILGVDAIITGSITQFGRDDKQTTIGGSGIGGLAGRYGLGGVGTKSSKAVVAVSARLINIDTAEILAVATGKGESTRSGTSLLGSGGSAINHGGGGIDMSSSNFANTILGEAVTQAVGAVARQIDTQADRLPEHVLNIEGMVADVNGNQVVINVGKGAGVRVGDRLRVKRTGREIRDPATGKVIRRVEESLGEITITEVDDSSAVGTYSGGGALKVKDVVTNRQ